MVKRIFLLSITVILLLSFMWRGTKKVPTPQPEADVTSQPAILTDTSTTRSEPTITIRDITLHEAEKCKGYEMVVTAQESRFHNVSDIVECCNVHCKISKHGQSMATVQATTSRIDRPKRIVTFQGPVQGTFKDLIFHGCDISYNFSDQIVTSDKTTTYTHPLFRFCAQQSTVNINAGTIQMSKGVQSEFSCRAASNYRS